MSLLGTNRKGYYYNSFVCGGKKYDEIPQSDYNPLSTWLTTIVGSGKGKWWDEAVLRVVVL